MSEWYVCPRCDRSRGIGNPPPGWEYGVCPPCRPDEGDARYRREVLRQAGSTCWLRAGSYGPGEGAWRSAIGDTTEKQLLAMLRALGFVFGATVHPMTKGWKG